MAIKFLSDPFLFGMLLFKWNFLILQVPVFEEKLLIGLEHAPPNFDVKAKISGVGVSITPHHIHSMVIRCPFH